MPINYGSVCSGIEAATAASHRGNVSACRAYLTIAPAFLRAAGSRVYARTARAT